MGRRRGEENEGTELSRSSCMAKRGSLPLLRSQAALSALILFSLTRIIDCKCTLFNFGDSNSDTGGLAAGLGFYLGPPSGRQFFHKTTGRFSDGRLYIDFICESLKIDYLSHYLESSGSNFKHGVNFAVAGAAVDLLYTTFPLSTQVLQFLHFKNRTRELRAEKGSKSLVTEEGFKNALYSIDIGQNDLTMAFYERISNQQIVEQIPAMLTIIQDAVKSIYDNGGRKFLIYNTGPLGCLPQTLAYYKTNGSVVDAFGCLAAYNEVAEAFNSGLKALCGKMRAELKSAAIIYADMFAMKYDLVANHSEYGVERPLMACCGHGGPPYNYKERMTCGQPTATACPLGSRYVSWDGVHYTELANGVVAEKILSARFLEPQIDLKSLCKRNAISAI